MPILVRPASAPSTRKGRATRERIVDGAAALIYRYGVAGTSTPAIRDAVGVSSSQIYHYFHDKDDLTGAVIAHQSDAIIAAQAQLLGSADLDALMRWRDLLVDTARQQGGLGGCPLGSLASELADDHPWAREALSAAFDRWSDTIRTALMGLVENRTLRDDIDVDQLALAMLAAIQGGLLLAQVQRSTSALEAGLDTALDAVRAHATDPVPTARGSNRSTRVDRPGPAHRTG